MKSFGIAAAVLAGGKNTRMPGENKSLIKVGGIPIIQSAIDTLKECFEEIIIVTNYPDDYKLFAHSCRIITDSVKNAGPLGGIFTALSRTSKEAVFFVACDMPFLHNALIGKQLRLFCRTECDAFVPRIGEFIEPLHAVYKKKLKKNIYDFLQGGGDHSIKNFLNGVKARYWDLEDTVFNRRIFTNVNTREELENLILNDLNFSAGLRVKSKVWLEKNGGLVFGSGKAVILSSILKTGSINKAAKELNMSYRHAWSYIKSAEKRLGQSLIICSKGGANGGSALLTPYARILLKKFEDFNSKVASFADKTYKEIF